MKHTQIRLCASAVAGVFHGRSTQYYLVRSSCRWIIVKSSFFERDVFRLGDLMNWLSVRNKQTAYSSYFTVMSQGLKEINKKTLTRWFTPRMTSLLKRQKEEREEMQNMHSSELTSMRAFENFIENFGEKDV